MMRRRERYPGGMAELSYGAVPPPEAGREGD
jgi:hypothetical protein